MTSNIQIPPGHTRVSSLHALPRLVRKLGGKLGDVLGPLQITEKFLANPDNVIPLNAFGELLYRGAKATGCEHFGLLVGSHSGAEKLGPGGALMLLAPTVGVALHLLQKYLHLNNRHAVVLLGCQGEDAFLGYSVLDGNFPGIQELQDGAMAAALNIMRQLVGPQWRPTEVRLTRRTPRQPEAYARFFDAPCRFNTVRSELVFPAATLDLPVAGSGAKSLPAAMVAHKAGTPFDLTGQDWIELVRRTALGLLLTGKCSRQAVADALGVSARTLNRRLEQAGASFLEIADYTRFMASRTLIKDTDMPLGDITRTLGYADPSAFCRAFKRWSNVSPSAWRKTSRV
jgi:AraC-like DNA-binding protein